MTAWEDSGTILVEGTIRSPVSLRLVFLIFGSLGSGCGGGSCISICFILSLFLLGCCIGFSELFGFTFIFLNRVFLSSSCILGWRLCSELHEAIISNFEFASLIVPRSRDIHVVLVLLIPQIFHQLVFIILPNLVDLAEFDLLPCICHLLIGGLLLIEIVRTAPRCLHEIAVDVVVEADC